MPMPMFQKGTTVKVYSDDAQLNGMVTTQKLKRQEIAVTIPENGGVLIEQ